MGSFISEKNDHRRSVFGVRGAATASRKPQTEHRKPPTIMKNVITLLFFLSTTLLPAQRTINQTIPVANARQLSLDFEFADVVFSTWDRPEVQVSGSALINNGENDDAFQLTSHKEGNTLTIQSRIEGREDLPKFTTVEKDGQTHYFKGEISEKQIEKELGEGPVKWISHGVAVEVKLEIKVPAGVRLDVLSKYGNLTLQSCSNPLSVENTYGHIEASFDQELSSDVNLHSTYSFVDVSLPARAAADIELSANYGTIYSDLDLVVDQSQSKEENFSRLIVAKLNGGGKKLFLQADYNNIYFRKR